MDPMGAAEPRGGVGAGLHPQPVPEEFLAPDLLLEADNKICRRFFFSDGKRGGVQEELPWCAQRGLGLCKAPAPRPGFEVGAWISWRWRCRDWSWV